MIASEQPAAELVVARKTVEADGVVSLLLRDPGGARLPDWAPGAHLDLVLPNGLIRQYSLCGDRWDAHSYRIGVLREPHSDGGSSFVHDRLRVGDRVRIGGPRNNFRLVPAERYLFIAGGIGITPLLPMLRDAELLGADWRLLYGGRSRASMAFRGELAAYGGKVVLAPQDECGLPDLDAWLPAPGATVYCCGPEPLLEAVARRCTGPLRTERFVPAAAPAPRRTAPFRLELRRSGCEMELRPDESILDSVRAAGVGALSSCGRGVCGTCETTVLAGTPEHRDSVLDDAARAAGDSMLICVSGSCSDRLVLDL